LLELFGNIRRVTEAKLGCHGHDLRAFPEQMAGIDSPDLPKPQFGSDTETILHYSGEGAIANPEFVG